MAKIILPDGRVELMYMIKIEGTPFNALVSGSNTDEPVTEDTMLLAIFYEGQQIPANVIKAAGVSMPCKVKELPETLEFDCMVWLGR